jgi:hypothetical protein
LSQTERDSRLDTIKADCKRLEAERSRFWKASNKNRQNTFERQAQELTRSLSTESDAAISVAGFLNTR